MGASKPYMFFPRGMQILPVGSGTFANPQTTAGTFTSGDLDVEGYSAVVFVLDVTAISGSSPTLDVQIQEKDAASGKYVAVTTFTQKTTTVTDRQVITALLSKTLRL
jgi:hypothetical protein